jgi:bifunctional non-homologous end joining protein LigD
VFQHACKMGLEGIVSKRLSAPYRSGPSHDWIKVKKPQRVKTAIRHAHKLAGVGVADRRRTG